jgi:hypothetical protein
MKITGNHPFNNTLELDINIDNTYTLSFTWNKPLDLATEIWSLLVLFGCEHITDYSNYEDIFKCKLPKPVKVLSLCGSITGVDGLIDILTLGELFETVLCFNDEIGRCPYYHPDSFFIIVTKCEHFDRELLPYWNNIINSNKDALLIMYWR